MAEIIKYGCIKDKALFELLESINSRDEFMEKVEDIVYTCCDIKRRVVEADERDNGERMLLNFGHADKNYPQDFFLRANLRQPCRPQSCRLAPADDIIIGRNHLSDIGDYVISRGGKVFILSDTNVAPIFANTVIYLNI